jgi:hypothetical protein
MDPVALVAMALFSMIFGILDCFFGYRIFRVVLSILGFIVGASIGMSLAADGTQATQLIAALIGGLIGAVVMNALYFVGIVIAGALLGALLVNIFLAALGVEPNALFLIIGAIVGGAVALVLNKFMIILSTGFSGAASVIYGITLFFPDLGGFDPLGALSRGNAGRSESSVVLVVAWIILGIAGVGVQYRASEQDQAQQLDTPT